MGFLRSVAPETGGVGGGVEPEETSGRREPPASSTPGRRQDQPSGLSCPIMSQGAPGHNQQAARSRLKRHGLLILAGLAWAATMAQVLRSEVLERRESPDVRALIESARLTRQHATARYVIRIGSAVVGTLASTVSGGRQEEQLQYVLDGELTLPVPVRLKGSVLASWDRRPERIVLEAMLGDQRHRLEGALKSDGEERLLSVRYLSPGGSPDDAPTWVLPDAPRLTPGPLPIPELSADALAASRSGVVPDPVTGDPTSWSIEASTREDLVLAGSVRHVRRHDMRYGAYTVRAWTEATGFPVRFELPGGIVIELAQEGPA